MVRRKTSIPEPELIALLRNRDQKGFTLLYDNYSAALYGIILKIVRSEETAADVMQEAFIKIWKNVDSYSATKGTLFTWILNVARNTAIDKIRSQEYRQSAQIRPIEENVSSIDSSFSTQTQTDMIGMDKIVAKLKPEHQAVIELIYFKGYTQTEVAEKLDIPLGTVKTRVKTAITQLRLLTR